MITIADAQAEFTSSGLYFNSASIGLPPRATITALHEGLGRWAGGLAQATEYDPYVERSRAAYAQLVGAAVDWVAITTPVSVATGHAAALLGPGDRVVVARQEFTSVLFPFLEAEKRGVEVRVVELADLLDQVGPGLTMVAVSAAQSADGWVIDLDTLAERCRDAGVLSFVDLTQAAGWLPINASRFDITAAGAYKWMISPRGTGFMTVAPDLWERMPALAAGWYAGDEPWASVYGPPLRLAPNARRFDVSPAWLPWVGAAPALELLVELGVDAVGEHDVALANQLRAGVGLEPSNSAILSLDLDGATVARLQNAGALFAERAGRSRFACHLYNTPAQVDRVVELITG
ncbi:MAG: aminotransferase class V-fold PLP-dependent enzyme [Actinomycetia bacterium]|nr:aminotransferase class V-fold PLP-dependent enzyme [Actinomycetes bacterium]